MTSDAAARRYLLGALDEEEDARLEREYFAGEPALDAVSAAEEELIEDYFDGRLSADEREQFEGYYLASPLHQTRVDAIRRLSGRASRAAVQGMHSAWRLPHWLGLAAAAGLLLASGIWLLGERGIGRRDAPLSTTAAPPSAAPALSQPDREQAAKQPPSPGTSIVAIELAPLALRSGGGGARLVVPTDVDTVELRLELDSAAPAESETRVTITTVSGREIWRGAGARQAEVVRVRVPASKLAADDYVVMLHAREPVRYFLRVRTR